MEMLSGAEMVVQSLVDQGVKQVFGYPGGAVLDIYDALHTLGGIDHASSLTTGNGRELSALIIAAQD